MCEDAGHAPDAALTYQPGLCAHVYEDGKVCGAPHDRSIHPALGSEPVGHWTHHFVAPDVVGATQVLTPATDSTLTAASEALLDDQVRAGSFDHGTDAWGRFRDRLAAIEAEVRKNERERMVSVDALPGICFRPNAGGICGRTETWVDHLPGGKHRFMSLAELAAMEADR